MDTSDLAKRMKEYEAVSKTRLVRRMPVIMRLDGRAFHTFTRGFQRPFDDVLVQSMQDTMKYLCENIQGCVLGYTQSDEITLVLVDYQALNSQPWFNGEVQKIVSISASMATMAFNKFFIENAREFIDKVYETRDAELICGYDDYMTTLQDAVYKGAMFDSRVFNIPKEDVTNCVYWRQLDASRNSIQMVGQANFPRKELHKKTCNEIQDMLMLQKGINWNDIPTHLKRGSCCIKEKYFVPDVNGTEYEDIDGTGEFTQGRYRSRWIIDKEIPIFKGDGREYIEKLINF